jgi:uncharacterized protein YjbJ (UPF0337 family)
VRQLPAQQACHVFGNAGESPVVPAQSGHNKSMGIMDKLRNKTDAAKGDAKQQAGKALDNEQMQAEGKATSAKGNLKQAGEKVKDAL